MSLIQIILEGRKEDFQRKFASKFNEAQLAKILEKSETLPGQNKYLNFMGTHINPRNFDGDLNIITKLLERFSVVGSNLQIKDINQYKGINDLRNALTEYDNRVRREIKTIDNADVVYEDDGMIVVSPRTYDASCQFGAGTKWCTTSSVLHFNNYSTEGKLFYFIDKKKPSSDPLYKVALLQKFTGDKTYYNAIDDSFRTGWIHGTDKLNKILDRVNSYIQTTFPEELKIWNDQELAKQERERLNRERLAELERQRRAQEQERRENDEWNMELYPDDEDVEKANAMFEYLVNNNDLVPLTDEEKTELLELKQQLEELQARYDNGEEDLYDEISEIESQIDELTAKPDIYSIILLQYGYYGMTQYEFDGAEYSVGTEDQIEEAAKESVENLLDDVGYEGFRGSFVENFIDEDEIERYIRDFFDYDIRENPESYLDDDQRELSSSQEREIRELQEEERTLEVERARLYKEKEELDTDSDDWEEKYDEMEERISEIEDRLAEIVDEIDEIKENPDGDYSEDAIDSVIDDRVSDYTRDPESFVSNYIGEEYSKWLQNNNIIDKDAFIEGVVEADGYGMCLNTYDGSYDTININGTDYYIVRTN
jgi:hypothetical protein